MGNKIAKKRKDLGMTQNEFAEKLNVTRQTVSRWEAGSVLPDIDKISDIASILDVSCDYLLKDEVKEEKDSRSDGILSRLLKDSAGRKIKLNFYEDEADIDFYDKVCVIDEFEGNWMRVSLENANEKIEKLIPLSSVKSIEYVKEKE